MKRLFLLVLFFWSLTPVANSQRPEELYQSAARLYKASQYQEAAAGYEKILHDGYRNAEVYFNLGNCYYKSNQVAKAILNFERAAKLSPEDEDIQHNLKLAGLKTVNKIQPVPQLAVITWWQGFTSSYSSGGWAAFAVISIWLGLVCFAVYSFIGWRRITGTTGIVFLVLSLALLSLAIQQRSREQSSSEAILMISNSYVKSAPDTNGNDLFMIHEGIKLHILDQVGTWYKIRLADGKVGWLEKGTFERV